MNGKRRILMNRIASAALALALGAGITFTAGTEAQAASMQVTALNTAAAQKGDPYRYGAAGPNAFDCSGLTLYSYGKAGKTLPRTAQAQYNKTRRISSSNLQPGDLVFIGNSPGSIYHVGIYAGYWSGKSWMWNANTGSYRGRRVVLAPISEYTAGSPNAYYGRV
jgi:cell wall-associated NlpC family hydrolase